MNYRIEKSPIGKKGQFRYTVYFGGTKIGQRISDHTYVACMVIDLSNPDHPHVWQGNTGWAITNWFGRKDLIGKGDSRYCFGKPGVSVAYLEGMEP